MREVRANFDKYLSADICELLAEYLSFVWKIFVAESELRSACKSGSLVTGYLQMITGVDNANHSGRFHCQGCGGYTQWRKVKKCKQNATIPWRDAATVHFVRTLDCCRELSKEDKAEKIYWESANLLQASHFDEKIKLRGWTSRSILPVSKKVELNFLAGALLLEC